MKIHYPILLHWSEEDGEWVATSPAWPGLSALDKNPNVAVQRMMEAMEMASEANAERGRPVPEFPSVAVLKHASEVLNISAIAKRAGLRSQTLHSKLRRGNSLTAVESASISNVLAEAGLTVTA